MIETNGKNLTLEVKNPEEVLVLAREILFPSGSYQGLKPLSEGEWENFLTTLSSKVLFLPRSQVEDDPQFKQIIPYLVFEYQEKVFLMERKPTHTESRLASKFTLGIGGHLRKEEFVGRDIFSWAKREFEEEVKYEGNLTVVPLGLLNDESNSVGTVHTGLVLRLTGDSSVIRVKEEFKSGRLLALENCQEFYDSMENWSQIVFNFLQKK